MDQSKLQANLEALRAFIQSKGWTIVGEKEIQSGYQLKVTDGITRIPVEFFTTGRALIQGKPGVLRSELKSWWDARKASFPQQAVAAATQSSFIATPAETSIISYAGKARIGLDESGKGDYFGPLVIAGVYVDEQSELRLNALGVRDSKLLTDNRILGWGHAWTLENMLEKVSCNLAIVDQFGDESYVRNVLGEKGRQITLVQQIHAEEDVAVAAASILARARFVQQLEQLSKRVGITLPKGASDPEIVTTGRAIVAKFGKDTLGEIAKLHFKTTAVILQS